MSEAAVQASPPAPEDGRRPRSLLERGLEAYMLVALTALLFLFWSVLPATANLFPTAANLRVTAAAQAVPAVIAIGALIPLICEEYDLSVGANAGLTSVLAADAFSSGWSFPEVLIMCLAVGAVVGIVNGVIITRLYVSSLVATLGTATILIGLVQLKTKGESIVTGIPTSLTDFGSNNLLGIPLSVLVALAVSALAFYVLRSTPFGRYLYAVGSNRRAAGLVGLRVRSLTVMTFVMSGVICGAAGLLQLAVSGSGNPNVGDNFTLAALAAAFLSVAAIDPGRYNVWGTIVAVAFLAILNSGLNLAGADAAINNFANGGALIIGVGLASVLGRRRVRDV